MESIDLKRSDLTIEESRGISTKKLLSTIKPNLKHKNSEILTIKTQQNMAKTQQELRKTQQELIKSQQGLIKSQKTQQN